jgi:hypothetical protein
MYSKYPIITLLLCLSIGVFAQNNTQNLPLPPKLFYQKAIVYDTLFRKMEVTKVTIERDKISFFDESNTLQTRSVQEIEYFKVRNGTYIVEGLGGGLLCGLLSLVLYPVTLKSGPATGAIVGGTTVLGGLIGLCSGKTKTYRLH